MLFFKEKGRISMKKIRVVSILPMLAVMTLIFFFSSQTAEKSSHTSSGITLEIARFLARFTDDFTVEEIVKGIHTIVRKTAHFSLYFMLGMTSVFFFVCRIDAKNIKRFLLSLGVSVLYAVTDEIHQIFVPGRAFMFTDILIDGIGSLFGCLVCFVIIFLIRRLFLRRCKYDI